VPLNKRLAWVAASAVALAVFLASIVCYFVVRHQLLGQVDSLLQQQAGLVSQLPNCNNTNVPSLPASAGGGAPIWQVTTQNGVIACSSGNVTLPVDDRVMAVVNGPPHESQL
jgi:hypothetical protein